MFEILEALHERTEGGWARLGRRHRAADLHRNEHPAPADCPRSSPAMARQMFFIAWTYATMKIVLTQTDFSARFAPVIAAEQSNLAAGGTLFNALTLARDGHLSVVWSPFEYLPSQARLAIVGITPGRLQAENGLRAFRKALVAGRAMEDAMREAKLTASFSGTMRGNLVAMLDRVGLQRALAVGSCTELFSSELDLVHFTSALRYPVFSKGENYNGVPDMLTTPFLRHWVDTTLAEEAGALRRAVWIPLGPKPTAALQHLASKGLIDGGQILDGLPHPSGANAERIQFFLGRKRRADLSSRTPPAPIEHSRELLEARIAMLCISVK